jgi:ABC-2 type transport system ATP-binding protein
MHYPRVLFLDEPTLGLDPQTRRHIWDYIKMLNQREKVTIILTTHYMEEADSLCSRIGIIDHGKILVVDTPLALKNTMGNDLLTITSADAEGLLAGFADQEWVKDIQRFGDQLLVGAQQAEEKIPMAVHVAQSLDIAITSISLRKPTLEDVFLHYTGKKMRDEDAPEGEAPRGRMRRHGGHH